MAGLDGLLAHALIAKEQAGRFAKDMWDILSIYGDKSDDTRPADQRIAEEIISNVPMPGAAGIIGNSLGKTARHFRHSPVTGDLETFIPDADAYMQISSRLADRLNDLRNRSLEWLRDRGIQYGNLYGNSGMARIGMNDVPTESVKLGDILQHRELYKDYPEMAEVPVDFRLLDRQRSLANYSQADERIRMALSTMPFSPAGRHVLQPAPNSPFNVLLHETDHALADKHRVPFHMISPEDFTALVTGRKAGQIAPYEIPPGLRGTVEYYKRKPLEHLVGDEPWYRNLLPEARAFGTEVLGHVRGNPGASWYDLPDDSLAYFYSPVDKRYVQEILIPDALKK